MNKTETARRYRSAQQIEKEAMAQAQVLADRTAAEFATQMQDAMAKTGHSTTITGQAAKQSAQAAASTASHVESRLPEMRQAIRRMWSPRGRYHELLAVVLLSSALGSVLATWLSADPALQKGRRPL